ncbi:MAG TPA: EAL domain-containing protein [Pseudoduganella sp.]|jgi:sensor c-di-GMP phosphodiesterase-like protein
MAGALLLLARRQVSLASALREALRNNEFFLVYQPVVELQSGRWIGAEALLRWRRASGEMIGPDLFIPLAEQTGTITQITARVVQLVEQDMRHFLAADPDFHVALNLAATDLHSSAIVDQFDALLARGNASAANLIVEITERGILDVKAALPAIGSLRERGIGVAIDDFGTGYAGLSYLEALPVDFLKIDRSFIEAIGTGAPTNQVVTHIIAMASAMGLAMIAEGVETAAQADYLRARGVQFAQGWLFGKPQPLRTFMAGLAQANAAGVVAPDLGP